MSMEEVRAEAVRRAEDKSFWAVCKKNGTLIGNLQGMGCQAGDSHV